VRLWRWSSALLNPGKDMNGQCSRPGVFKVWEGEPPLREHTVRTAAPPLPIIIAIVIIIIVVVAIMQGYYYPVECPYLLA